MRMRAAVVALAATGFLTSASWRRTSAQTAGAAPGADTVPLPSGDVDFLRDPWTVTAVEFRGRNFLDQPVDIPPGVRIHHLRVIVSAPSRELTTVGGLDDLVARRRDWMEKLTSVGVPVTVLPKDVRNQDLIETHAAVLIRAIVR